MQHRDRSFDSTNAPTQGQMSQLNKPPASQKVSHDHF